MKALTLHQPWSWAIAHAGKRVENRTWAPPASVIGQRVAIHAGLKHYCFGEALYREHPLLPQFPDPGTLVHGAVESVATIAGWVGTNAYNVAPDLAGASGKDTAIAARHSPWWVGPIGWVLTDVSALPEPVPCKGAQGLWTLPGDVESAVLAQLGGER